MKPARNEVNFVFFFMFYLFICRNAFLAITLVNLFNILCVFEMPITLRSRPLKTVCPRRRQNQTHVPHTHTHVHTIHTHTRSTQTHTHTHVFNTYSVYITRNVLKPRISERYIHTSIHVFAYVCITHVWVYIYDWDPIV